MTGSSRGIGKAIALRLARDGFNVVINDISANKEGIDATVKEVEAIGRKSHGIVCDVTSFDDVKKMIDEVVERMGKIDVSVSLLLFFCIADSAVTCAEHDFPYPAGGKCWHRCRQGRT